MIARAAITVVLLAGLAHADNPKAPPSPEPDPIAQAAGEEANLESLARRKGFVFGISVGPSVTIGGGTGTGGALSLKLGQVAGPRTVIMFEVNGSGQLHKADADNDGMQELIANNYTSALGGVQYWFGPSVYFRLSGGFGAYQCNKCQDPDDPTAIMPIDYRRLGVALGFGAGVEFLRFRWGTLGFDAYTIGTMTKAGFISSLAFALSLSID